MLSLIAPHHCCGCDKIGTLLCDNCKYNISHDSKMVCVVCKSPTSSMYLCNTCKAPYERVWVVGERKGILQRLIGNYKFERVKSSYKPLGDILLDILPELPFNTVVVPIPTIQKHIRQRGYDHMLLIAKYVAKSRGLTCNQIISRKTNTKQRQASSVQREQQAKQAFIVKQKIDASVPYLLIDDVITTGATIKYASQVLSDAGAKHIWIAIIARQTID